MVSIHIFYIYTHILKIFKIVNIFQLFLRLFNTVMILILRNFAVSCSRLLLYYFGHFRSEVILLKSLFLHSITGKQQM